MRRRSKYRFTEPSSGPLFLDKVRELTLPLKNMNDFDVLLKGCEDSKVCLMGEASHGTSEFYSWRAELSKRLIEDKKYSFVAVEGDWPDCYRINQYVKGGANSGVTAEDVLSSFDRWPSWMWSNEEVADFVSWLKDYNQALPKEQRVGFYGLDVYSLWDSLHELEALLCGHLPASREVLEATVKCFQPYRANAQAYAHATYVEGASCEAEVKKLVAALQEYVLPMREDEADVRLQIVQNAETIKSAEHYYRAMVRTDSGSWNIRDKHMASTLDRLLQHYGSQSKGLVWEHNTHIGDARYTDMSEAGMLNLGQIARQQYGDTNVKLIGFSSYKGRVIAGRSWGAPMQNIAVPAARPDSWEDILHQATHGCDALVLFPQDLGDPELLARRGHRAIGVVYQPKYDYLGNYVPTVMPKRYDALVYLDQTNALRPLAKEKGDPREVPDTFPSAV